MGRKPDKPLMSSGFFDSNSELGRRVPWMIHDCTTPSYCNSEADVFLILARVKRGDMGKDFVLIGHKEAPAGADFSG